MIVTMSIRWWNSDVENNGCSLVADEMIVDTSSFWTCNMSTYHVLVYILLLYSQSLSCAACYVKHTKKPLHGYHCVSSSNTEVSMPREDCVLQCLTRKTCHYIHLNYGTGKCNLGLDRCESLEPVSAAAVNVFGPPPDACVRWDTHREAGRIPVQAQFGGSVIHLARMITNSTLLIGKFVVDRNKFWANNEGMRVGHISETGEGVEFLTMDLTCTLLWMNYTAGGILPDGVISGGYLPDGSKTYASIVAHGGKLSFGYYNRESQVTYYEQLGVHTTRSMEILVLLWTYIFIDSRVPYIRCYWGHLKKNTFSR